MLRDIRAENPAGGQASFDRERQNDLPPAGHCLEAGPTLRCPVSSAQSPIMSASGQHNKQLCLQCGLCCNGVLFKDVELQPGDDATNLRALGLPIRDAPARERPTTKPAGVPATARQRFPQPCTALFADNRRAVVSSSVPC